MELKLFPQHSGIWEGTYKRIDPTGKILFEHKSKLTMKLLGKEWYQTNHYHFADGREELHNFGLALFNDEGVMTFDNPRIYGQAWEGKENIMLTWTYKEEPGSKLFEMITMISDKHRMRVWQFSRNDVFEGLMMIEEWQTAHQDEIPMSHYETKSFVKT